MKFRSVAVILTFSICLISLSGCVALIIGGVGAVGGYAVTRDTIQGEYDAKYSKAWIAASDVCSMLGTLSSKDKAKGTMEAFVERAKVKVDIIQLTPEAIRVKVKARKGLFPRLSVAEKVFVKIVQQLME